MKTHMKLKLGNMTIQPRKIKRLHRLGSRIAVITFKNGETLRVICGVSVPEKGFACFLGTYEELKSLIERMK